MSWSGSMDEYEHQQICFIKLMIMMIMVSAYMYARAHAANFSFLTTLLSRTFTGHVHSHWRSLALAFGTPVELGSMTSHAPSCNKCLPHRQVLHNIRALEAQHGLQGECTNIGGLFPLSQNPHTPPSDARLSIVSQQLPILDPCVHPMYTSPLTTLPKLSNPLSKRQFRRLWGFPCHPVMAPCCFSSNKSMPWRLANACCNLSVCSPVLLASQLQLWTELWLRASFTSSHPNCPIRPSAWSRPWAFLSSSWERNLDQNHFFLCPLSEGLRHVKCTQSSALLACVALTFRI